MTNRLSHRDLETLLSAIAELNADLDAQTLPERAVAAAAKIIHADSAAFTGISYSGEYEGFFWDNSENVSPADMEIFAEFMHEQPLFDAYIVKRRTETLQITDLMPAKEFQRTNVYNEFYKKVGVRNQLVAPMKITDDFFMSCSINTLRESFSDRDKLILSLMAPHFASVIRNSFAHERLLGTLDAAHCGIISLTSQNAIAYVSRHARSLVEKYFAGEKRAANSLPESLARWLEQIARNDKTNNFRLPPAPLKIIAECGELIVRPIINSLTREKSLLLEEKKYFSPETLKRFNLTRRETEVLFWIAQGKTDDVIKTILQISLRTVHKHVGNIYAKLGVETRIAAMLKTLDI